MNKEISIAQEHSQFITRWFNAKPDWKKWVQERYFEPVSPQIIDAIFENLDRQCLTNGADEESLMRMLRETRQKIMLWVGVRDLNNLASLSEVTSSMTRLAELSIQLAMTCLEFELSKTYGAPYYPDGRKMPLWIVGMGKLGGRELNVSSDIDLIFVYDADGETNGGLRSISHHEWFTKLGKKLIRLMSDLTGDGFVFRVDMRLRPNGDAGPLVCSLGMLEEYFLVQGREWERYAWIKGRLVYPLNESSKYGLPDPLYNVVKPFVYRRYLDFGVIRAIRDLHAQIRHEANLRATNFPDRAADLKLGRGGIREIEFLAQMFQLIRGGQEPQLRVRPTLEVLDVVGRLGLIEKNTIEKLSAAYIFLRQVEHRIQWWDDAQIHYLPASELSQERIARGLGYMNREDFYVQLNAYQDMVANTFADVFALDGHSFIDEQVVQWSPDANLFPEIAVSWSQWKKSIRYRVMPEDARKNLASIFKKALEKSSNVDEKVFCKFLEFLEIISLRSSYLSLLIEYPLAVERVMQLIKASSWGSAYLLKHPQLLDEMLINQERIDTESTYQEYWEQWRRQLCRRLDDASVQEHPQELMMDILREAHHSEIFHILLADLGIGRTSALPVEVVSDRLSALADILLEETLARIWDELGKKYGVSKSFSESGFGVIAYGKLGGKELGYGSDLDLVFIYDETIAPLSSETMSERFAMLVRRLIMWLTTATSAGTLFDIDTRLRPNGMAGLMVSSVAAFEDYQLSHGNNSAWIWEHQALSRARFCAGDLRVGRQFDDIRARVLAQPREPKIVLQEISLMRRKIHEGHPNLSRDFDLKHDPGGMVDIEFIVQYLVLAYANKYSELIGNIGNIALLQIACRVQLIPQDLADEVANAYRVLRQLQHRLRLDGVERVRINPAQMSADLTQAIKSVKRLWNLVMTI